MLLKQCYIDKRKLFNEVESIRLQVRFRSVPHFSYVLRIIMTIILTFLTLGLVARVYSLLLLGLG